MSHRHLLIASGAILIGMMTSAYAAKPVDLSLQPALFSQKFNLKQTSTKIDFNKTKHVRVQQFHQGYPVWGADAVMHIPQGSSLTSNNVSANGIVYQELAADLQNAPAYIFSKAQADKVLQQAIQSYEKKVGAKLIIKDSKAELMVFVDPSNKAHWTFLVSFLAEGGKDKIAKPSYIMDAVTFEVLKQWNNLQTVDSANGGGFGGNVKIGQFTYDGLQGNLPSLNIRRDASSNTCYMQNDEVVVKDVRYGFNVYNFKCEQPNTDHNKVFWNGDSDAVNGGYSASDDAMFAGAVIKNMYQDWYGEVPLKDSQGNPMMLTMCVHKVNYDNAYWDGKQMVFGDGASMFYPLVSLGVAAHEISHGFTEQHSHLAYWSQSGGMNEAFSDMAAQAAEYFAYGHNSWQIGPEIFKAANEALRYMDIPSKDCRGGQPGNYCSIDNAKQFVEGLDVHYSSGVFNRMFYLLGTAKGWNTRKAFNIMVQANENYWTSNSTFAAGACGVLKATKDYNKIDRRYDFDTVKKAIDTVGIDTTGCKM